MLFTFLEPLIVSCLNAVYFYLYKSVAPIKKLKFKAYPVQRWRSGVLVAAKYSVILKAVLRMHWQTS